MFHGDRSKDVPFRSRASHLPKCVNVHPNNLARTSLQRTSPLASFTALNALFLYHRRSPRLTTRFLLSPSSPTVLSPLDFHCFFCSLSSIMSRPSSALHDRENIPLASLTPLSRGSSTDTLAPPNPYISRSETYTSRLSQARAAAPKAGRLARRIHGWSWQAVSISPR